MSFGNFNSFFFLFQLHQVDSPMETDSSPLPLSSHSSNTSHIQISGADCTITQDQLDQLNNSQLNVQLISVQSAEDLHHHHHHHHHQQQQHHQQQHQQHHRLADGTIVTTTTTNPSLTNNGEALIELTSTEQQLHQVVQQQQLIAVGTTSLSPNSTVTATTIDGNIIGVQGLNNATWRTISQHPGITTQAYFESPLTTATNAMLNIHTVEDGVAVPVVFDTYRHDVG